MKTADLPWNNLWKTVLCVQEATFKRGSELIGGNLSDDVHTTPDH
jgi:hypothetical protein